MSKLTARVFKVILFSTLIIITGVLISYVITMYSLNHKIEAISSSLRSEVARNNYLTEESKDVYLDMFEGIIKDHSRGGTVSRSGTNKVELNSISGGGTLDNLVKAIEINYDALKVVKPYGDFHTIEIKVYVSFLDIINRNRNVTSFEVDTTKLRAITYVYRVPCYRYIK